jgi:hypothetical protein
MLAIEPLTPGRHPADPEAPLTDDVVAPVFMAGIAAL